MTEDRDVRIRAAIALVEDPEVPVTLSDLGVIRNVQIADGAITGIAPAPITYFQTNQINRVTVKGDRPV